jgi:hypothetical protein
MGPRCSPWRDSEPVMNDPQVYPYATFLNSSCIPH